MGGSVEVSDMDEFAENRLKAVYNLTHVRNSFASRGRHYTITAEEGRRSVFFVRNPPVVLQLLPAYSDDGAHVCIHMR